MNKGDKSLSSFQLKHLKYKEQRQGKLDAPSKIDIHVVASGSFGTSPSVYVDTDYVKYLFNCGEGTQRLCIEHKAKITRIENVLVTHKSWKNIGGLLGMALTLEGCKVPKVNLHGPPNVDTLFSESKGFAQLHQLQIEKVNLTEDNFYEDEAMRIYEIPIFSSEPEVNLSTLKQSKEICSDKQENSVQYALEFGNVQSSKILNSSIVYVCKPHPKPRNVDLEKCVDVGLTLGPLVAKLKNGESVTLENGNIINPEQVLSPPEPVSTFIVIECPSANYLDSLVDNQQLKAYTDNNSDNHSELIIHFTPRNVVNNAKYREWMESFGPNTKHLLMKNTDSDIAYEAVCKLQTQLNMINSDIFPTLPLMRDRVYQDQNNNFIEAESNLTYVFRCGKKGKRGFVRDKCITYKPEEYKKEVFQTPESLKILADVKKQCFNYTSAKKIKESFDPCLTFLGTGSSLPNKVRNVSSILLQSSLSKYILMDCGEGTYGQLYRHFGEKKCGEILRNLSFVFISHMHADHHMGVFELVIKRREAFTSNNETICPQLTIVAPGIYSKWLSVYDSECVNNKMTEVIKLHYAESLKGKNRLEDRNINYYKEFLRNHDLEDVETVPVVHRQYPHGLVIKHIDGWKLVYSGDTMPCDRLVDAGKDCDILIHEATMEDELEEEAATKRHSTTTQALNMGRKMGAKFTLLTHFSQRYAKVPKLGNQTEEEKAGLAFDNMTVKFSSLNTLPLIHPALGELFADEIAQLEQKTYKRKMRKQRRKDKAEENPTNLKAKKQFISDEPK
ncbi:DgyrCDS2410 [Dimorphilus gyrociliatus]|uniref:Zinc phosphodiesterase ELAC protein 2 n=1 Tax=Dimorphilus gyrociliatus TaxID=2664684 RepID=A0A7I8VAK7_9ANNE|nr:DgyrCDS2410 [Dimorphilus gyrociliatus]